MFGKSRLTLLFAVMVCFVSVLSGCKKQQQQAVAMPKPHVTATVALEQRYIERFDFPGRIEAVNDLTLKTRVSGFLKERLFKEGDVVKKGQLLFTIEKEPFEARVAQASADLAKAEADAKNAGLNLQRALELRKSGNISQAALDAREAQNASARAYVMQAKATLNLAKIDLSYTNIRAPFTGKIGLADFTDGEFLPANTTLASMVSCDPMYVVFSVSEQEMLSMQAAGVFEKDSDNLAVTMHMADGSVYRFGGEINFFDVTVDEGTDTVKLRASFPNPENHLIAGQYVTVALEYEAPQEKIVIPQASVMSSAATKYVYVVGKDNKVISRPVVEGPRQGLEIVILKGLEKGERVIVDGLQKVRPMQEVVVDAPKTVSSVAKQSAVQNAPVSKPVEKTAAPAQKEQTAKK